MKSLYQQCLLSCDNRRDLHMASPVLFGRTSVVPTAMLLHSRFHRSVQSQAQSATYRMAQQVFAPTTAQGATYRMRQWNNPTASESQQRLLPL